MVLQPLILAEVLDFCQQKFHGKLFKAPNMMVSSP